MRVQTQADFDNILDCFTGADGGVRFAQLLALVRELDTRAAVGDSAAQRVLNTLGQLSRLIDVADTIEGLRYNP